MLGTLRFKLAGVPTVLEFLERYLTQPYFQDYSNGLINLTAISKYLAYLQIHHI